MLNDTTIIAIICIAAAFALRAVVRRMRRRRHSMPTVSGVAHKGEVERATLLHVIDGDTVYVILEDGTCESVRVIGIDAPESACREEWRNTPAGHAASAYAETLMRRGQDIWLERDIEDRDRYGRLLRHVWLAEPQNNRFADAGLACAMVGAGHAVPMAWFPNLGHADEIARARIRAWA